MLSRQCFPIDDNHTGNRIVATVPCNRLFSLILGQAIVVKRSRHILFRIETVAFPVKHKIRRQMDKAASLLLATVRQILHRRHINRIRLFTVLLTVIRDGKSRAIDHDIRAYMIEQDFHCRIIIHIHPDKRMLFPRLDIRMKRTTDNLTFPVRRKFIQNSPPSKPVCTYNQYLFHQNI